MLHGRRSMTNMKSYSEQCYNVNQMEQITKLKGERTIWKRQQDSTTNPNQANLAKVHRSKNPPERNYVQSPKNGGVQKLHREQSTSSQEEEDAYDTIPAYEATAEANLKDADYEPQETVDFHEITKDKKPRRSSRPKKKPTKHVQMETLSTDEDTDEAETSTPIKGSKGIENFQPVQVRRRIPRKDKKTILERHTRYQVKHKSIRRQTRRHLWQETRC